MSMLSCRVLCLLAIVLCCVGVTHAASGVSIFVKDARDKIGETLRLKKECEEATNAAREAANEAQRFALDIGKKLKLIAADPDEVNKTKSRGHELIENAVKASKKAEEVRDKTTGSKTAAETAAYLVAEHDPDVFAAAENAANEVDTAVYAANDAINSAKLHAEEVENLLKKLDDALAAAEKKENQVESQPHPQTNETSLGEQQGHTEGNKAEQ
ncbi:uncharacterized protein TM35_000081450, partial [Trypanosoma theileri]